MRPCTPLPMSACIAGICVAGLFTAADGQPVFTDVSQQAGIDTRPTGIGLAWGDYDADGRPDAAVSNQFESTMLLHNEGEGRFRQVLVRPDVTTSSSAGLAWADEDGDGDLDLFQARQGNNRLFRSDGRGGFEEVGAAAGVSSSGRDWGVAWADVDGDGWLDLFVSSVSSDKLYHNQGDGTYTQVASAAGVDGSVGGNAALTQGVSWADYDRDGLVDLYVGSVGSENLIGGPNRLYRNQGDFTFVDMAEAAGVAGNETTNSVHWGDLNDDSLPDLFLANWTNPNQIFLNQGDGTFRPPAQPSNVGERTEGSALGDADGDGDLDLYAGADQGRLYLNNGDASFTATDIGITGNALVAGVGWADYDGDLDLDLYLVNHSSDHVLLRNDTPSGRGTFLDLVAAGPNERAVGAEVMVRRGSSSSLRLLSGGSGTGYQNTASIGPIHPESEAVTIRWPSGAIEQLGSVPTGRRLRVVEGQGIQGDVVPVGIEPHLPTYVGAGQVLHLTTGVRLGAGATDVQRVIADLRPLGGAEVPLADLGAGRWQLDTEVRITDTLGPVLVPIVIEHTTTTGRGQPFPGQVVTVVPPRDIAILQDAIAPGWQLETGGGAESALSADAPVLIGNEALVVDVAPTSFVGWRVKFVADPPVPPSGLSLRFALRPGAQTEVSRPQLNVRLNQSQVIRLLDEKLVDLSRNEWQTVELPFDLFVNAFGVDRFVTSISFEGNLEGTFYLDDIALATPLQAPPMTAVTSDTPLPTEFQLRAAWPNPFNGATSIRFSLAHGADVDVTLYNLAGQPVATLTRGWLDAGWHQVRWDGRTDDGRPAATGIYFYRLRAAQQSASGRLTLLR